MRRKCTSGWTEHDRDKVHERTLRAGGFLLKAILLLAGTLGMSFPALADPEIARVITEPGQPVIWYVKGIEGSFSEGAQVAIGQNPDPEIETASEEGQEGASARIGSTSCPVDAYDLASVSDVSFTTVILLDNSLSISEANREKAKNLIAQIIQNHADGEVFEICTFDTDIREVGSGTDYNGLSNAAGSIEFHDQDAYLNECLATILGNLKNAETQDYYRIILISDGMDDNPLGRTSDEILEMLGDDAYHCPIYTVCSVWDKNTSGLKNLQAMSRKTGSDADTFVLDQTDDVSSIAEALRADYDAKCFLIHVPLKERDGNPKSVHLSFATSSASGTIDHMTTMPQLTDEEANMLNEEGAQSEKVTEPAETEPEKVVTHVVPVTETETSSETETEADSTGNGLLSGKSILFLLIAVLAGAIAAVIFFLRGRKQGQNGHGGAGKSDRQSKRAGSATRERGAGDRPSSSGNQGGISRQGRPSGNPAGVSPLEETIPERMPKNPAGDETVGMWDDGEGETIGMWDTEKKVILTDVSDSARRFEGKLSGRLVIGRSHTCGICINDDETISKEHLALCDLGGEVAAEDLGSRNGSSLNGQKLEKAAIVHSGDELKLGRSRLKIEIR